MGGGLALGEAMTESNLLTLFSLETEAMFRTIPLWPLLVITLIVTGVVASFMNSTAASAILYPFIRVIGAAHNRPNMFVVLSAMMISGGQLFDMSSFANALVASVLMHTQGIQGKLTGETFLVKRDFPLRTWPITLIITPMIVASIGFGICLLLDIDPQGK
jgi:phosphate transporter